MPSKAGPSLITTVNAAQAARAAAHPYANAHANARGSKRTLSIDEKPQLSPTSVISPTDTNATPPAANLNANASASRPRKKNSTPGGQNQTKSNRQQFSACHACRYRRVKCDLKDVSENVDPNADASCTNCRERGIRCKDDFKEDKKQLRRGKRINQLELEDNLLDQAEDGPTFPIRARTTIPALKPEFFDSPFYRRFYIQRPIIDPVEFRSRYIAWLQHQLTPESNAALSSAATPLSMEGQLLAKILVVWAAAYGVDECGLEQPENSVQDVQKRRIRVKGMLEEVIRLIDSLSLLRRPTWDGVRCLLLALPLTEDVLDNPIERLAMYEAALQQVYTLCQHDGVTTGVSSETRAANAMVRARIFWYAHVHEGLTTGLRGGRLLMDDDDLRAFQRELPPTSNYNPRALQLPNMSYSLAFQYAAAPIQLASACRKVHAALTGPKARASKRLDGQKLEDTWESLAQCWENFESLRPIQRTDHVTSEDHIRFIDGWQIFLFECYNVIQEKIRDRLDSARAAQVTEYEQSPDSPATVEGLIRDLNKYLAIAESKCFDLLDHVVRLIRRHLGSSFFAYDASLVRDGCFFAGHTLALMPGRDEDVRVCLQALSEMRWAFSKGNERSQSIRLAWRSQSDYQGPAVQASPETQNGDDRNPANGTPRSLPSNPSSPHKRAHPTPPSNTYTASVQQQQLHVASLPSHTAPRLPTTASTSSQPPPPPPRESPLAQQQRHMPPQDIHSQMQHHLIRQDFNATPVSSVDRGMDQFTAHPHWSPVRNQPPLGPTSTHSSSSDGSSPPEITSHSIPHYNMPIKSPTSYEAPPGAYRHTPTETPMFSHTHPRTNGNVPSYPPVTGQARHMGAGLEPMSSAQQYPQQYPVSYHPGANQYPPAAVAASNGMNMNHFVYPARQPLHTATYATGTLSPDEISGYTNGSEYFALPPTGYRNVIPGRPLGHETTAYVPYPDNGLYYAPH